MKIGGFTEISTVDYPGEVASVIYVERCNLKCPYCHNPTLVRGEETPISVEDILHKLEYEGDLKTVAKMHFADAVVITGGEPTIYGIELIDLIMKIKNLGYKVKLDTNGLNTNVMEKAIVAGVDYVAMDIKTSLSHYFNLSPERHFAGKLQILMSILLLNTMPKGRVEFRHTCVDPFTTWLLQDFPESLKNTPHPFYLQPASLKNVLNPDYACVMSAPSPTIVKEELERLKYLKDIRIRG